MKFTGIIMMIFSKILEIENMLVPYSIVTANYGLEVESRSPLQAEIDDEQINDMKSYEDKEDEEIEAARESTIDKQCAIVVLSNVQNPTMQSLLRKYRYDSKGILIPQSVKYFMKYPQGLRSSPLLVPLNDKAFSPQGGFVRYYKEVPPIPHST